MDSFDSPQIDQLRTYDLTEIRRTGEYGLAYCPRCECSKSGDAETPNRPTDACSNETCPCHDGWTK